MWIIMENTFYTTIFIQTYTKLLTIIGLKIYYSRGVKRVFPHIHNTYNNLFFFKNLI